MYLGGSRVCVCVRKDTASPVVCRPQVKEALLKNVKRRMTPQPLKIRADVEMTCFHYDGEGALRG